MREYNAPIKIVRTPITPNYFCDVINVYSYVFHFLFFLMLFGKFNTIYQFFYILLILFLLELALDSLLYWVLFVG